MPEAITRESAERPFREDAIRSQFDMEVFSDQRFILACLDTMYVSASVCCKRDKYAAKPGRIGYRELRNGPVQREPDKSIYGMVIKRPIIPVDKREREATSIWQREFRNHAARRDAADSIFPPGSFLSKP